MQFKSRSSEGSITRCRTTGLSVRWFIDEQGSTLLGAMLAVVLAITLVATGVQWYWVSSSSTDIQSIADLGALAGADAIAKTATVIQLLDLLLLSLNVVAVLLHLVVVVSGVVVVTGSPVGGASMATLFQKAVEFDRKFVDFRRRFAAESQRIAQLLSDSAPYLAMGQAHEVVRRNSVSVAGFTKTSYVGTVIPFPLRGEVTLTSAPSNELQLVTDSAATSAENGQDAVTLEALESQLAAARQDCWDADSYRTGSVMPAAWNPEQAIGDFERELTRVSGNPPEPASLPSAGESEWSDQVIRDMYFADYRSLGSEVQTAFTSRARAAAAGYLTPRDVSPTILVQSKLNEDVFLVAHTPGERRAYHSDQDCVGLSGATADVLVIRLSALLNDPDHPPCSLCEPAHWGALASWLAALESFSGRWNGEATAIRNYESIRQQMGQVQGDLSGRTQAALDAVLASAQSILRGGRLTYRPPGSRGLVCVVFSKSDRALPSYTLPSVTEAGGRVLGQQVALSGAALSAGGSSSAVGQAIQKISGDAASGKLFGFAGSVMMALGLNEGVSSGVLPLWRAGLDLLQGRQSTLSAQFNPLPWGLDGIAGGFVDDVSGYLGLEKPDMRQVIPVLVSVSEVGDPAAGGTEGAFASAMRQTRASIGSIQSVGGAARALANASIELTTEMDVPMWSLLEEAIFGKQVKMPFDSWSMRYASDGREYAQVGLPVALWEESW